MAGELERVIGAAQRRLRARELERRLSDTLRWALLVSIGLIAADHAWRLRFEPWYLVGTTVLVATVAGLVLAGRRRWSPLATALLLDERLGLAERLSSGLAAREAGGPLAAAVVADADRHAAAADWPAVLPRGWSREARISAALALVLLAVAALPRFTRWRSPADRATEMVSRQVGQELVVTARQTERQALDRRAAAARSLARRLHSEALALRRARLSQTQGLRRLEQLNHDLQTARERLAGQPLRRSGRDAREDLRRLAGLGRQVAEQLDDPKAAAAAQRLRDLAQQARAGKLTPAQRKAAAAELERAAEALDGSRYQRQAARLREAAKQLRECSGASGPACERAAQALDDAAQALREGDGQAVEQELLERMQADVQGAKQALGQAEQIAKESPNGRCPSGLCQTGGSRTSGTAGRGRGPGSTNRAVQSAPSESAAQEAYRPGDSPPDKGPHQPFERLYAPQRTATKSQDAKASARLGQGGRIQTEQGGAQDPRAGEAKVPYYKVYGTYRAQADDALASGRIPLTRRHEVQRYFDSLQPAERDSPQ